MYQYCLIIERSFILYIIAEMNTDYNHTSASIHYINTSSRKKDTLIILISTLARCLSGQSCQDKMYEYYPW